MYKLFCALLAVTTIAAAPHRDSHRDPHHDPHHEMYGPVVPPTPYDLCEAAVEQVRPKQMPATLMSAISRVESGRLDPATNRVRAWPWTINVNGIGFFFATKEQAIASVQDLQSKGTRSIDVGCMQVNLFFHPTAFATLDDAFDPSSNAAYAARFLVSLYSQARDWPLATAQYHSQTQELGEDYQRRVFGQVMTPMGPPRSLQLTMGPYGAFPLSTSPFGAIPPMSYAFAAFAPAMKKPVIEPLFSKTHFSKGQATARR